MNALPRPRPARDTVGQDEGCVQLNADALHDLLGPVESDANHDGIARQATSG